MQVGMTMPIMHPDLDASILRAWARAIDEGPFASVCFGERIAFDNPETLTLLEALAAWTDRVRLVSTVIVAQLHDPVMLAKVAEPRTRNAEPPPIARPLPVTCPAKPSTGALVNGLENVTITLPDLTGTNAEAAENASKQPLIPTRQGHPRGDQHATERAGTGPGANSRVCTSRLPDHHLGIVAARALDCVSTVTVCEINGFVPDTEHAVSLVGDWRVRDDGVVGLAEPGPAHIVGELACGGCASDNPIAPRRARGEFFVGMGGRGE